MMAQSTDIVRAVFVPADNSLPCREVMLGGIEDIEALLGGDDVSAFLVPEQPYRRAAVMIVLKDVHESAERNDRATLFADLYGVNSYYETRGSVAGDVIVAGSNREDGKTALDVDEVYRKCFGV